MKRTTVAVVGSRARDIGEQMERQGGFTVIARAHSFTQLLLDAGFPTRYVILEEADDPDCTRARISIAKSLGARVVLVRTGQRHETWDADLVVDRSLAPEVLASIAAAEEDVRRRRRVTARQRPLTPITPRERQAIELWGRLHRIPAVAEELGVGYTTAATLIKRARKKLAQPGVAL